MTDFSRPDAGPDTDTTITPTPSIPPPTVPVEPAIDAVAPVATTPVSGMTDATSAPPKRSRVRWVAALAVIALVVTTSAAAALMLTGASPAATVMGYVPADSVVYGEVRLDLPGDQKREIGEFLSKFPGFADQAALDTKLDEVLDRLVSEATDGEQTFTADIKPWFDGEMAFAVGPLPEAAALTDPESATADGRALLLLSIKDAALAAAWFDDVMAETGTTGTTETYEGVELTVFADAEVAAGQAAFAIIDGKVAVAGDVTSVKAAVDTGGNAGLTADPEFAAASASMDGDHVGFVYMDLEAIMDTALELSQMAGDTPQMSDTMLALIPDWAAFRLRVEGDALVMDGTMPHNAAAPGPDANRANAVAGWAPPATVALVAGNDYGATLLETIELLRSDPALAETFAGIDQAAGVARRRRGCDRLDRRRRRRRRPGRRCPRGRDHRDPDGPGRREPVPHHDQELRDARRGHRRDHGPRRGLQRHHGHDHRPRDRPGSRRHGRRSVRRPGGPVHDARTSGGEHRDRLCRDRRRRRHRQRPGLRQERARRRRGCVPRGRVPLPGSRRARRYRAHGRHVTWTSRRSAGSSRASSPTLRRPIVPSTRSRSSRS